MANPIDVDRGVSMRQVVAFDKANPHKFQPDMKYGGLAVYMYKDDPGVYYDAHGKQLPEGMAALAGFPITLFAKARRRKEAMAKFDQQLSEELALEDDKVIVLQEAGDWQVIAMPMDRAKIVDKDSGDTVTAAPMSRADALQLLKHLTGTAKSIDNATGKEPSNGSKA